MGDGCSARCEEDYTDTGRACVSLIRHPANYLEAILDCQTRGGLLASVLSQEEQDIIAALTESTGAWIGLTDFLDVGKWVSWVDGSEVIFTAWRPGAPNNHNNNQHCTWIRPDGGWDDITCKKKKHYVCQKPIISVVI